MARFRPGRDTREPRRRASILVFVGVVSIFVKRPLIRIVTVLGSITVWDCILVVIIGRPVTKLERGVIWIAVSALPAAMFPLFFTPFLALFLPAFSPRAFMIVTVPPFRSFVLVLRAGDNRGRRDGNSHDSHQGTYETHRRSPRLRTSISRRDVTMRPET